MTFHLRLRVAAAAALAAAVAVPVAGAANPGRYVQIGGELVVPAQLSSWQAHAAGDSRSRLVQIGGALVAPEQLSSWQANASQAQSSVSAKSTAGGSGFDWNDAGVGIAAALGAVLFVGASAYVRRMRLTSA